MSAKMGVFKSPNGIRKAGPKGNPGLQPANPMAGGMPNMGFKKGGAVKKKSNKK